jgi:hypothetical protein
MKDDHAALRRFSFGAAVVLLLVPLVSSTAAAAQLLDGTPIQVRPVNPITSESASNGQPLEFVVVGDITANGKVLIAKGTKVAGVVVDAHPSHWSWTHHNARLVFKFKSVKAVTGQVVMLRATPSRTSDDRVIVERSRRRHNLQWTTEGDTYEAYVDGDYVF